MCIQCILLGALVNAGVVNNKDGENGDGGGTSRADSRFRCESLSHFDFAPPSLESIRHIVDETAELYLVNTLRRLRTEVGLDLRPLRVEDDGSCLPHAISRCLVGHEVYYDALRLDLQMELRSNADWYRRVLNVDSEGNQVYDDDEWSKLEWKRIVEACMPTYGERAGPERWLGPEHVLGLSNLLGRPILLLNTPEIMADVHHGNRGGLFLPLRRSRADIMKQHAGAFPSPIVVGYSSPAANHYVALVRVRSSSGGRGREREVGAAAAAAEAARHPLRPIPEGSLREWWERTWGGGEANKDFLIHCSPLRAPLPQPQAATEGNADKGVRHARMVLLEHPVTGRRIFALPSDSDGKDADDNDNDEHVTVDTIVPLWSIQLEVGMRDLITEVGPAVRDRTIRTLRSYVRNLTRAQEEVAYGKFDRLKKVSTIPLDGGAACRWIANVPGALSVLEACGYRLVGPKKSGGGDGDAGRCMRLEQPPVCLCSTAGNGSADEEKLRRAEGLRIEDTWLALRHAERLLVELGEASSNASAAKNGEIPGNPESEQSLLGSLPRYSWLGVGPDEHVDSKTRKVKIPSWPAALSSPYSSSAASLLWEAARQHYGSGLATKPDGAWTFGSGSDSTGFCDQRILELEAHFYTLTQGLFGKFRNVAARLRFDQASDIIIECPSCGTSCLPSAPPEALAVMGDDECIANCPNPLCGIRLDVRKTYRRCVADAVTEAARGSLGGVWKCAAPVQSSASDDEYGGLSASASSISDDSCEALNIGYSNRCVRCGTANPSAIVPENEEDLSTSEKEAEEPIEVRMHRMITEMLESSMGDVDDIMDATQLPTKRRLSTETQAEQDEASILDFHFVETLDELMADDEYEEDLAAAIALSMQPAEGSGAVEPLPVPLSIRNRGKSCPLVLSVMPETPRSATTQNALRVIAERANIYAHEKENGPAAEMRETSCPVTEKEWKLSQRKSGIDLDSMTRNAALALLRKQSRLRSRSVEFTDEPKSKRQHSPQGRA